MGDVHVLVLMLILIICNSLGVKVNRLDKEIYLEGDSCRTPYVDGGKCMNIDLCDPAFLHSLSYDHHVSACRQNAFYTVFCCQPFLEFCTSRKNKQIAHPNDAKPGMFPHIARLVPGYVEESNMAQCSANIISVNFLLSAAHCKTAAIIALVGCHELQICKQHITVKNFISHPKYKRTAKYHDIALVELQNNIKFNERVLPICPYAKMGDLPETVDLIIAGWGHDEDGNFPQNLKHATVRTIPIDECKKQYRENTLALGFSLPDGIIDQQYCAHGTYVKKHSSSVDACRGDSGGPLQVKQNDYVYLIGIINNGYECGSNFSGLYTRVAAYYDWINNIITGSQSLQTLFKIP